MSVSCRSYIEDIEVMSVMTNFEVKVTSSK